MALCCGCPYDAGSGELYRHPDPGDAPNSGPDPGHTDPYASACSDSRGREAMG